MLNHLKGLDFRVKNDAMAPVRPSGDVRKIDWVPVFNPNAHRSTPKDLCQNNLTINYYVFAA